MNKSRKEELGSDGKSEGRIMKEEGEAENGRSGKRLQF
jgi:hypothetical protein